MDRPPLRIKRILAWADAHYQRTGRWPSQTSGPIAEAPGETWLAVHTALRVGLRGQPERRRFIWWMAIRRSR